MFKHLDILRHDNAVQVHLASSLGTWHTYRRCFVGTCATQSIAIAAPYVTSLMDVNARRCENEHICTQCADWSIRDKLSHQRSRQDACSAASTACSRYSAVTCEQQVACIPNLLEQLTTPRSALGCRRLPLVSELARDPGRCTDNAPATLMKSRYYHLRRRGTGMAPHRLMLP